MHVLLLLWCCMQVKPKAAAAVAASKAAGLGPFDTALGSAAAAVGGSSGQVDADEDDAGLERSAVEESCALMKFFPLDSGVARRLCLMRCMGRYQSGGGDDEEMNALQTPNRTRPREVTKGECSVYIRYSGGTFPFWSVRGPLVFDFIDSMSS